MSLVAIVRWRISKKDPMIYENIGIFIGKKGFQMEMKYFCFFFLYFWFCFALCIAFHIYIYSLLLFYYLCTTMNGIR